MTKSEILAEQKRLNIYIDDAKRNLPEVLFLSDANVSKANTRLNELDQLLKEATKVEAVEEAKKQIKETKSSEALKQLISDLRVVVNKCEDYKKDLMPSAMGRYYELVTALKRELR